MSYIDGKYFPDTLEGNKAAEAWRLYLLRMNQEIDREPPQTSSGKEQDFSAMTPAQRLAAYNAAVKQERAPAGLITASGFLPGGGSPFNYSSDHVLDQ